MGRQPKARVRILEGAERVVRERGAAALTFDEVCSASGVTRGGITYHFPTKEDLLRALVERDRDQWAATLDEHRAACECPHSADVVAYIRSATERDDDHRRFVSGMLGAVAHDPELLASCRALYRAQITAARWTDHELRRLMLRLAADGLFWMETFGFLELPAPARRRYIELLEALAAEWSAPDPTPPRPTPRSTSPKSKKRTAAAGKG